MELVFEKYHFNIKNNSINCIIGKGINLELLEYACKYVDSVKLIIHPIINNILYKTVKKELSYAFEQSNHRNPNKIVDSLKIVGLDNTYLNKKISDLSSSELYLIRLASILLINPKILILESPNIYLDYKHYLNFLKIIRTIKRRYNKTIIIFSNDSDFIHSIADYIFVINEKGILEQGNKYEIFTNEKLLKKCQISMPKIILFEKKVFNKIGINIGYRDNINDLIKDIYTYK